MITTICLNPSIDKTVEIASLEIGEVNRIRSVRVDMGGKGLNVAVVAHRLGLEVQCIGCMGRESAQMMDRLISREEGLKTAFLQVPGDVRTNLKVVSSSGQGVTEFNELGEPLSDNDLNSFFEMAEELTRGNEYVVVTGSVRPGCSESVYRDLMCRVSPAKCILDCADKQLIRGLEARPFLIKPNLSELESTMGTSLRTLRGIRAAAVELVNRGAQNVIVSMGKMGALFTNGDQTLFAPGLPVQAKSTVGAGDAMVGGLLMGLKSEETLDKALRYGIAAGAASVLTEGTQLMNPQDFKLLLPKVQIQEV